MALQKKCLYSEMKKDEKIQKRPDVNRVVMESANITQIKTFT